MTQLIIHPPIVLAAMQVVGLYAPRCAAQTEGRMSPLSDEEAGTYNCALATLTEYMESDCHRVVAIAPDGRLTVISLDHDPEPEGGA